MTGPEPRSIPRAGRGPALLALVGVSVLVLVCFTFLLASTGPALAGANGVGENEYLKAPAADRNASMLQGTKASDKFDDSSINLLQDPDDSNYISLNVSPASVSVREVITFTITITNVETISMTNVEVFDDFEDWLDVRDVNFDDDTGDVDINDNDVTVTVAFPELGPGEIVVIDIVLRVNQDAAVSGTFFNTASLTYRLNGFHRREAEVEFRVIGPTPSSTPTSTLTPTTSGTPPTATRTPTVTPTATGTPQAPGISLLVLDEVSDGPVAGVSLRLQDENNKVFEGVTGANGRFTFSSTPQNRITPGRVTIRASKPGFYEDKTVSFNIDANTIQTREIRLDTTDLVVTITDNTSTVSRSESIDYRIRIQNAGSIPATGIVITDTLGTTLTYSSLITNTITTNPANMNLRAVSNRTTASRKVWTLVGTLNPNQRYEFIVRATVSNFATGSVTNTVEATTESPEAEIDNNEITDTNTIGTTGTNLTVTKSASPQEVRPGQNITFSIDIENNTNSAVTITRIFDAIPAGFEAITANLGGANVVNDIDPVVNQSTRNVTVEEDFTLNPGQEVRLAISARVSSSASATTTGSNTVTVSIQGGGNRTASASFRIVAQGTLPGTGFGPPGGFSLSGLASGLAAGPQAHLFARAGARIEMQAEAGAGQRASLIAFLAALLLGGAGAAALVYGLRGGGRGSEWGPYAVRMGLVFAGLALVFAVAGLWLNGYPGRSAPPAAGADGPEQAQAPVALPEIEVWLPPSVPEDDLPSLPDFPIPTPQVSPTPGDEPPDSSPIVRISIPAIGVNNEVKYVPFDGLSWMISGLRHEVAWLGETSWPGLGGNTALAAHVNLRGGENGPFRYLEDLIEGDVVRVYTEQNVYEYRVRARRVVNETDLSVIEVTGAPQLTLITCTGWDPDVNFYLQRTVVFADLVEVSPNSGQISSQ